MNRAICRNGLVLSMAVIALVSTSCQTNRLSLRMFRDNPDLYYSKTLVLSGKQPKIETNLVIVDERSLNALDFQGNKNDTQDFFHGGLVQTITTKIQRDGIVDLRETSQNKIEIHVKSFYMGMYGFFWSSGKAVVDISVTQTTYEATKSFEIQEVYKTDGSDKEYEGSTVDTVENAANVTLGMTLRKAIDKLYARIVD